MSQRISRVPLLPSVTRSLSQLWWVKYSLTSGKAWPSSVQTPSCDASGGQLTHTYTHISIYAHIHTCSASLSPKHESNKDHLAEGEHRDQTAIKDSVCMLFLYLSLFSAYVYSVHFKPVLTEASPKNLSLHVKAWTWTMLQPQELFLSLVVQGRLNLDTGSRMKPPSVTSASVNHGRLFPVCKDYVLKQSMLKDMSKK